MIQPFVPQVDGYLPEGHPLTMNVPPNQPVLDVRAQRAVDPKDVYKQRPVHGPMYPPAPGVPNQYGNQPNMGIHGLSNQFGNLHLGNNQPPNQPVYGNQPNQPAYGNQYGQPPYYGNQPPNQPGYGNPPAYGNPPGFGNQPPNQPVYGNQYGQQQPPYYNK